MASNETNIRVLVSFYLTPEFGKVIGQPTHKDKFNVPVDNEVHKELHKFKVHFASFTSVYEIARSKDRDKSRNFARINKVVGRVEAFSIRTQDAWQYEFPSLVDANGMLQGKYIPEGAFQRQYSHLQLKIRMTKIRL